MKTSARYSHEPHESHAWLKIIVGLGVAFLAVTLSNRVDFTCYIHLLWQYVQTTVG